ncbi:MAG TPA: BTAD domain-containing putative transcriptional regulator [Candidatus Limnocylindrales bacterium]
MWDGAAWSTVRAAQQRVVLAVLLTEAGRAVSTDRMVEEIWGEHPPRAAVVTMQGYVSRLRRLLRSGPQATVVTQGRGYQLLVQDGDLDSDLFEHLVETARRNRADGDLEAAVARLSEALAFWEGQALADVSPTPTVSAYAARLEQVRLDAVEERLGALLELGRYTEAVSELGQLVDEQPLRERLWAQFMLALHHCGRRPEALLAYQRARETLLAELGVEPSAELRDIQRTILADEVRPPATTGPVALTAGRVKPAQLPADVADFTGRGDLLDQLDAMLDGQDRVMVLSAIAGAAGVGKTALAVHWGHRVRDRFPGGQLYVNLRGYAAGAPVQPIEALAAFLTALGVPAKEVPAELEQAAALYRSLLDGERMLVLLDNARSADQIRPLLPGTPGCLVVVTSRDRMTGLVARDGAARLDLGVLSADDTRTLLIRLLSADRVQAEPEAVAELAELCGHLPLALRIAAANLTAHPGHTIADYTARLRGDRLTALAVDGDPHAGVRAAFDHSYRSLPDSARGAFRLLGLVPGPDITAEAAAALTGVAPAWASGLLDKLTSAHLVQEHAPGRYALHDLLRRYAEELTGTEDSDQVRHAALGRLYHHYLDKASAAAGLRYHEILRLPPAAAEPSDLFDDADDAGRWLNEERQNLVAAVTSAAGKGHREIAWRLADAVRGYLYYGMHLVDWQTAADAALAAADASGEPEADPRARAAAHLSLGVLRWVQGRLPEATDLLHAAARLAGSAGWLEGEAAALGSLGAVHTDRGRLTEAQRCDHRALALMRQTGWLPGMAGRLASLGVDHLLLGQLHRAADNLAEAITLHRRAGAQNSLANAMTNLGITYHHLGRLADAHDTLDRAVATTLVTGDRFNGPYALSALAAVKRDDGRLGEAHRLAETAEAQARDAGDPRIHADTLTVLASILDRVGQHRKATDLYRAACEQAGRTGPYATKVEALVGLATAERHSGRLIQAATHAADALNIARRNRYRMLEGDALTALAAIHLHRNQPATALDQLERALVIHTETGELLGLARSHLLAEHALCLLDRAADARRHHDAALGLFAGIGIPYEEHERILVASR